MVSGLARDGKMSINAMYNELAFKKKNSRIDWRKIAGIDLDRIARDMDVYTLQENIDHITFCNIDAEIDTRMMDPNYVKLFKISQFIIEYLIHSQNYLTDIIGSVESQFNVAVVERDDLKKLNEKLQKDLLETKKENKRRKKMIETQQTLMSVTSSNYHQCAYCSKVFLNISYLQAHMTRRHSDVNAMQNYKLTSEIEKELERIKDRLRTTENELQLERTARLGMHVVQQTPVVDSKQVEQDKNNEIKRLKDEFKRNKMTLNNEIHELTEKNGKLEKSVKDLEERLGKQSHVGWIKDDIDLEKDNVLKLKKENEILNETITNYKKQLEDLKTKCKSRETLLKQKHSKEITEKNEEIANLKERIAELQNSVGKNENELAGRLEQLLMELQEEQQLRFKLEQELNEYRKQPPKITPRKPNEIKQEINRSPSPVNKVTAPPPGDLIYLTEYCPLTLRAVQADPNHLNTFRKYAEKMLEENLDEVGIDKNVKGLSKNDFKLVMKNVKEIRQDRADDMASFNGLRKEFAELSTKLSNQKFNSASRSIAGNRVTFKKEVTSNTGRTQQNQQQPQPQQHNRQNQHQHHLNHHNTSITQQSEETDDDVSLSNALESYDDNTEPTKSLLQENQRAGARNKDLISPRKGTKIAGSMNPDEISDLESISQLLSDRSASRKKERTGYGGGQTAGVKDRNQNNVNVSETKRKLEKQLEMNSKRVNKPTPNAVPVGFQADSKNTKYEDSFSSISDIENELKSQRPKSGVRSSLQDSQSSSVWVTDSHSNEINHQPNHNNREERPATANSSKTLNFDSDDIENVE